MQTNGKTQLETPSSWEFNNARAYERCMVYIIVYRKFVVRQKKQLEEMQLTFMQILCWLFVATEIVGIYLFGIITSHTNELIRWILRARSFRK